MKKVFLLTTLLASSLFSATFNVSTTPELRTALSTAATNGEDDTIILADGTYKTTDDGLGTFIYLSNEANSLTLQGSSADNVILDGNKVNSILSYEAFSGSILKIAKIKFINGGDIRATTNIYGGAIFSTAPIQIVDSTISNNYSNYLAGGIYCTKGITVENSVFYKNTKNPIYASNGVHNITDSEFEYNTGPIDLSGTATINNSRFFNNSGGAIVAYNSDIINSIFIKNNNYLGGTIDISGNSNILNSVLINNNTNQGNNNGAIYINGSSEAYTTIANSIIYGSTVGIEIYSFGLNRIINSILSYNTTDIYEGQGSSISYSQNNLIGNYDLIDIDNNDYRLIAFNEVIDAGTIDIEGLNFTDKDLHNYNRIVGTTIDIGPYEYQSPIINSISYTGSTIRFNTLEFTLTYTLVNNTSVKSIEYDFLNNGIWTSDNRFTFNLPGKHIIKAKVTDSDGVSRISSIIINITDIDFDVMSDEQKLLEAINPIYYESIMAIIKSKESTAKTTGISIGESNVISNPTIYGLNIKEQITKTKIDSLSSGWNLIGTPSDINDLSIFSNVHIIWTFDEDNQSWNAYSPKQSVQSIINNNSNIKTLTNIPAQKGFWIYK